MQRKSGRLCHRGTLQKSFAIASVTDCHESIKIFDFIRPWPVYSAAVAAAIQAG
jgi:hypothetical protein